jgi:hypothetical protein
VTTLQRPDNPGTYISLVGESAVRPPANVASTVAIPIVHDWGPIGSDEPGSDGKQGGVQLCEVFGNFDALFGNSDTDGRDAALGAFVGPGVPGEPGAGGVLVYRMATSAAKASTKTIKNTKEAPEDALVLTAVYKGERGDRISYVIDTDPTDEAKARLRIRFDGVVQERYSYAKTDITALAAAINARSKYVTAEVKKSGIALATTTGTALAGGNNGDEVTATEWEEALSSFELQDFSIFAPFDLTDDEVIAMVLSWVETQAAQQTPVFAVLGGKDTEDLTEAIEKAEDIRNEHIVRVAGGKFHDDFLDKDISTSKLAARIAGILAGRGEESSLTFAPIAGLKQVGSTIIGTDELALAAEQGLTVFRRASRPNTDLVIAKGVTTYTNQTDPTKPYELFSDPRIVRVADLFLRRMKEWGDENIIGPTRVIETTKAAVRQRGIAELSDLESRGMILPGTSEADKPFFRIVDDPGPSLEDAIVFEFGWKFARTTNFLIGTGKVR